MGSIRKVLSNVEYIVFVLLTLIFVNSSRGARLDLDARVNAVKVIFFPKIEENSIVPKLFVGSFSQVVLSGKNLEEGLRAVLTKRSGNEGKYCDSNSFVSPVYKLQSFKNFNNSVSMFLSAQSTNSLNDIKNVWVCLSTSNINENSQKLFKTKDYKFIHQGKASKILVLKSKQNAGQKYNPTNVKSVVKTVSKRSISEYSLSEETNKRNSSSKPVAWEVGHSSSTINQNRIPETLISTSEPKIETKERTSNSNGLNSEFRTSVGISEFSVPHLILSSYQNYSTNYSGESNLVSGLKPTLSSMKLHQAVSARIREGRDIKPTLSSMKLHQAVNSRIREGRDIKPTNTPSENSINFNSQLTNKLQSSGNVRVFGIRVESHSKGISYKDGAIELLADYDAEIRLFGSGLTPSISVQFTAMDEAFGGRCDASTSDVFPLENASGHWAIINIRLPRMSTAQKMWYLCIREGDEGVAVHQGNEEWLTITTYSLLLPIWIQIIILVLLLILSGLFSGLNLGLMALDKTELKIVMNTGTPTERKYAKSIEPVRRHGNFLLCTLLLGNVLVNSTLTILLDTLSSGLIAVIGSTIGIVIFGEIVPQAICSRHGLAIGAKTVWLVRMFMVITGVVSYPISKMLDCVLGEEIGNTYDRERLKELIRVTQDRNDLQLEEQNIIYGALELHRKTVTEIMTKIDDVYMLNIDRSLDFHTINEIMQQGYSRIPIYENERTNIVSVLLIKDLAFIDPDDNTPLRTVTQFYQNACTFVFEDTTLDVIFKEFKKGNKGHMAFVQRVNNECDCDPFYEVVGLVTLEDVIEELIQEEIVDETDVFTDNKTKRRRKHIRKDFKEFSQNNQSTHRKVQISPQMQVAAFQYLRTTVEPFKEGHLSEGILKRMLNQDIIHVVKNESSKNDAQQPPNFIFVQGKPVDFFVLILEGHVEVTIGKENLTFESGPFTYFGLMALTTTPLGESPSLSTQLSRNSIVGSVQSLEATKFCFTPDYSVKGSTEVTYLKVKRSHYIAARRAFLLEQSQKDPLAEETFEKEMEKILRDESLTTPVWESSPDRDADAKEALLNGGAIVAKDEDQLELSIFADGRRHSLRETLMISRSPNSLHNPNGSVDTCVDHVDRLSNGSSAADEIGRGDQPTRKSERNSPTIISI